MHLEKQNNFVELANIVDCRIIFGGIAQQGRSKARDLFLSRWSFSFLFFSFSFFFCLPLFALRVVIDSVWATEENPTGASAENLLIDNAGAAFHRSMIINP